MRILHISDSPCAGAIHALSTAITDLTEHESRWIGRSDVGALSFPRPDVTWQDTRCYRLLAEADALVLHNYIGVDTQPIRDFLDADPRKIVAAYYHSHPDHCNLVPKQKGYGSFCAAQFQALLHEGSIPIRSVIRYDRADWPKWDGNGTVIRIGYAPTSHWSQREPKPHAGFYDSKGYPETIKILESVEERLNGRVEVVVIDGVGYDMAIRIKARCHVFIDEVVTGSYHRNALEALAMGIPTICRLDLPVIRVLAQVTGCRGWIPFLQSDLEALEEDLVGFCDRPVAERLKIGENSRNWMQEYWQPREIAQEFCKALAGMPCHGDVVSREASE